MRDRYHPEKGREACVQGAPAVSAPVCMSTWGHRGPCMEVGAP